MKEVITRATVLESNKKDAIAAFKAQRTSDNAWLKFSDTLFSEGVRAVHLEVSTEKKPNDSYDKPLHELCKEYIVESFPIDIRALIEANTKALSPHQKIVKKEYQQKIGAYVGKLRSHLIKLENQANGVESVSDTENQKMQKALDAIIDKMQKATEPGYNVIDCIALIKKVKTIVPAV